MTTKITRRITGLVGLLIATFFSVYTLNDAENRELDQRSRYNQFLDNHPFSYVPSEEELAALPKQDRPDLAMQQNYLSMVDPQSLTVPYERTLEAFHYTQRLLSAKSSLGQKRTRFLLTPIPNSPSGEVMMEQPNAMISVRHGESLEAITVDGNDVVWEEQGPTNVGGRTRAIIWDPNDPTNRAAFAGGVSGGLWYNTNVLDPNSSWTAIDDFMANLAVTTLAVDPTDSDVIYAGTGEGYFNFDAVRGVGIFKSTDGGDTWSLLTSTEVSDFAYVNKIVVTSTGVVLAATRGSATDGGIYRSDDGGTTWDLELEADGSDIEIAANGDIYASRGIFSPGSVFKSTDGGLEWTNVTPNADTDEDAQRIEIATAPTNSNLVYAMAQDGRSFGIDWVQRSTDGGATWTNLPIPTHNDGCDAQETEISRGQAWYDLILAVAPENENVVIAGGVDLARSDDAGDSWTQISEWFDCSSIEDVHADQHQIVFRPDNPNEALFGTDGGVYYSPNVSIATAPSFESRNRNYAVTQFYAVATDNVANSEYFIAGAQDNGTQQLSTGSGGISVQVVGGDGAYCHVDQLDRTYQIASTQNGGARHSVDGGLSFNRLTVASGNKNFINQTDYDNTNGILYSTAGDDQYGRITGLKTTSPSAEVIVDVDLGDDQTSAIRANANTDNRIFVGTEGGLIFRIDNAHDVPTVTNITSNISTTGSSSAGTVSSIDIGSSDDELIVTYSNFGIFSVWYTADGGTTWVNKDNNHGLPDIPIRWALFNPNNTSQVMLATELGVWSTNDITAANPGWEPTNEGLANVRCDMLLYRESDGLVVVGTHGRGIFTTNIFSQSQDKDGPLALSFTPEDNESEATSLDGELEIQFNEAITKGTGNVVLRLTSDDSVIESIDVTSDQVLTTGFTATINPTADLSSNTGYYVEVDAGAFEDNLGNAFAGITGSDTWNFTTFDGDLAPIILIPVADLELDENSQAVVIDLSNVFTDADNDDAEITKDLVSNSDVSAISVELIGDNLTITPIEDRIGEATLVVRGTSNGKTVDDSFVVTLNSVAEQLFVQTNASNSGLLEGFYTDGSDFRNVDDFVIPGGQNWSISTVTTEAFSLGSSSLDMQSIDVTIYSDSDGTPNETSIVHSEIVLVGSGSIIGGSTASPSLTVRLTSPVDLTSGTYWLSIHPTFNVDAYIGNSDNINTIYAWHRSSNDGNSFQDDGSGVFASVGREMMFSVDGESTVFDAVPEVVNPIEDLDVVLNPEVNPVVVDLSEVFTDPDNEDSEITIDVVGNTNTDLIAATVSDNNLSLLVAQDGLGRTTITLQATSNGLTVDETFNVTVLYDELYAQTGDVVASSPSQIFPDFGNVALESADEFVVPDGEVWSVGQVSVVGDRRSPSSAIFYIYSDIGGLPGDTLLNSGALTPLYTNDNTDFLLISDELVDLDPGTYWISVQIIQEFDDSSSNQWFWSYTSPAVGSNYAVQDFAQLLGGAFPSSWGLSSNDGALIFSVGGEVSLLPETPTDLVVSNISSDSFDLAWVTTDDATTFVVDVSVDDFATYVQEDIEVSDANTITIDGLSSNTTYQVRVQAINNTGSSGESQFIEVLTLPSTPTSLIASNLGETSFDVSWTDADNLSDYRVDISTDDFTTFVSENTTSTTATFSVAELTSNTTYQVRVQTVNATGSSAESHELAVVTLPVAPTATEGTDITGVSFTANWTTADGATTFELDVSQDDFQTFIGDFESFEVTGTSTSVTGLTEGNYVFRVRATNASGGSTYSNTVAVEVEEPLSIEELVGSITVYPNPSADGVFNLDYQQINNKPLLVKVYSILGREILSVDFSKETNRFVDLSNQPNGTLIMEIIRGDVKRSVVLMKR